MEAAVGFEPTHRGFADLNPVFSEIHSWVKK